MSDEQTAAALGAALGAVLNLATDFLKGRIEHDLESINLVKRVRQCQNEMVKQKMCLLDEIIQCDGENPALNSIRLQITQSCSLMDSIEYYIKKGSKRKAIWDPILKDLERLSKLENTIPQPRELLRKKKDPRNNYPENIITSIYEKEELELKQWMIHENEEHSVIAICGMVGVGKTTLAKIAFDSVMLPHESPVRAKEGSSIPIFDRKIWASASGGNEGDPLTEKITMLIENPSKRIVEELRTDLKEKNCLIVLDDLQNISGWKWLRGTLNKSTRVIVTTSSKEIAQSVCKEHLIQLEPLRQEKALEVFCLRAFNQRNFPKNWPESRRNRAEKIVHHCGGLPLSIIAFGDYVKELGPENDQWESFSETPNFLMGDENDILKLISEVIKFRIRELPYNLMRCLMYFSMYPSGYVFNRKHSLRLLVSHTFTESENSNWTPEQLADKEIIKNLHDRFLIQGADQSMGNAAPPHRFWIHNVVRQVVLSLSEKEYFGKLLDKSRDRVVSSNHHHVIVDEKGVMENIADAHNLCSVSFLGKRKMPKGLCSKNTGFMLLRVLSLRNAKIEDMEDVKNLLLLRYLDLKYTNVRKCLWLKFLEELETVDLRYTRVKSVPDECLLKLKKLRHLLLGYVPNRAMHLLEKTTNNIFSATSSYVPEELRNPLESGISSIFSDTSHMLEGAAVNIKKLQKQNMQTLRAISAPQELKHLSEIVDLFITGIKKRGMNSFWNSVEQLENLTCLGLSSDSPIEVKGGTQLKGRLQKLHIQGSVSSPLEELCKFINLNELTLSLSGFQESFPIKDLSSLSHLFCLKLYNVTKQKTLTFGPDGFEKLIKLVIADMKQLELIEIASEIMGRLTTVKLCDLPNLTGLVVPVLENDGASEQENYKYILRTKESQKLTSHLEVQSLKSIFLRDINDVDIIYGPDVYKYNGDKKCYIADA